ncbi:fimbrillin family protein [Bacteroides caecimuris]|uniref:fimbrillin family protein n=1 Tax=Bacteroides caecimuris TaxID=1796613 RepID=UPI002573738C|nr:fimbrillin family protein [Bacteroides caecimuris]
MKVNNYISMLFLAGAAMIASCSQNEELGGDNPDALQGFQISVSDKGFTDMDKGETRAVESGYATRFSNGDAIGVFAVKGDVVVEAIRNRQFTMEDGVWVLSDGGDEIEYKGSEFERMQFYAYYPYNKNVIFDPTAVTNPFEEYIKKWTIGADQGEGNYTKYDLMTSTGTVKGDRLKGQIAFDMKHEMALAVVKMPKLTYSFTNGGIDDYLMPIAAGSFTLNNAAATPYYQATTDTYRFLVNPNKEFLVKGTYTGVNEMEYEAKGTLESGTAKMYTIEDKSKINHTLQVGDYFCADGKIVSVDTDESNLPDNVIGIVCYVGNPQPHVTHPDKNNETNDALFRDYPACTHGLVLALSDSQGTTSQFSGKGIFSTWYAGDDDWKDKFTGCNTGNSTNPGVMFPGYKGYNNTTLLTMCYENGSTTACDPAYTYITAYREEVAVPAAVTPWYIPSLTELTVVAGNMSVLNTSIKQAGGNQLVSTNKGELIGFYWSSDERNDSFMWLHHMGGGEEFLNRERGSRAGYFRMMLAF